MIATNPSITPVSIGPGDKLGPGKPNNSGTESKSAAPVDTTQTEPDHLG